MILYIKGYKFGSGALNCKMQDLGLLKISFEGVFSYFRTCGRSKHVGHYPDPFPNPAGQI